MKFLPVFLVLAALSADPQRLGVRLNPTSGGGGGASLTPSDLTYRGVIRQPLTVVDTTGSFGSIGGRNVAGNTHIFMYGTPGADTGVPFYEFDVTGLTPTTDINTAPYGYNPVAWGTLTNGALSGGYLRSWTGSTTLTSSMTSGQTTIGLASSAGVTGDAILLVDSELIVLNGASGAPNYSAIFRGTRGSSAAAHSNGATVYIEQDLNGLKALPDSLYWNETTQLLCWTYNINYTDTSPYTLGCTSLDNPVGPVKTYYGPFNFSSTDQHGSNLTSTRANFVFNRPSDGKMCSGGVSKSGDAGIPWGPSMFCGGAWPTTGSAGGPSHVLTPYAHNDEYLDYLFDTNFDIPTGTPTGPVTSFRLPLASGLTYVYEYPTDITGQRANPLNNGGRGTWSGATSGVTGGVWIDGTNKDGVIFWGVSASATGTSTADCVDTTHNWYRNVGLGNEFCAHGCACVQCASAGDSLTKSTAAMWFYSTVDLENVKNGATDWATEPTYMVDAVAQYGITVAPQNQPGQAKIISGGYYDTSAKRLYLNVNAADHTRPGLALNAILVFDVDDSAVPEPFTLAWLASKAPDWTHGRFLPHQPPSLLQRPR